MRYSCPIICEITVTTITNEIVHTEILTIKRKFDLHSLTYLHHPLVV
jgi:hypothetical protein